MGTGRFSYIALVLLVVCALHASAREVPNPKGSFTTPTKETSFKLKGMNMAVPESSKEAPKDASGAMDDKNFVAFSGIGGAGGVGGVVGVVPLDKVLGGGLGGLGGKGLGGLGGGGGGGGGDCGGVGSGLGGSGIP